MNKRLVALFSLMTILAFCITMHTFMISNSKAYVSVAGAQSVYTVRVCRTRGRIYDRHMRSLAGGRLQYRAVIAPSQETVLALTKALDSDTLLAIKDRLTGRHPFVCDVPDASCDGRGAIVYPAEKRYGANYIAPHVVGYVDGEGTGVYGIERVFDDYLAGASGELSVRFQIDATGAGLSGVEPEITDTTDDSVAGVVLTLDMDVQQLAEKAAEQFMEKGAIIIMGAKSGEILASVSCPDFSPDDVAASLDRADAPFVNRALSAYDAGSVFKLAVAAAALESGVPASHEYVCTGSVTIGENIFNCSNRSGHGRIDMEKAVAHSCNTYFIELASLLGGERILEYARLFGFGESICLAGEYLTAAGCLPSSSELQKPAALANISFGQGTLLTTPLHIAAMTAAIADDGVYHDPSVYLRLVDRDLAAVREGDPGSSRRIISQSTARQLRGFMRAASLYGTAVSGSGDFVACAAKTGTAQTGIKTNGREVVQAWMTGFFPYEEPEYIVTVLVEDGVSGGSSAAPVFKYLADRLAPR